ncbi:MAG: YdcF family protein [PVC group bacterium]
MFTFLKLIKPFFLPPTAILIGMVISLCLFFRKKWKGGRILLIVTAAGYYFLSTGPAAYLLVKSLERTVPFTEAAAPGAGDREPAAIVVLAGGAVKKGPSHPRSELEGASWNRLWRGIELYREYGGRIPIIYSGGSGSPFDPESFEAELARSCAVSIGIPPSDFWTENLSRNTCENARETKRLLDQRYPGADLHRVILVTSSIHMPRSILAMRRAGIDPVPSPADFLVTTFSLDPLSLLPSDRYFTVSTRCLHEWLGIVAYRLLGRL